MNLNLAESFEKIQSKAEFVSRMKEIFSEMAADGNKIDASEYELILSRAAELRCKTEIKRIYAVANVAYSDAPEWVVTNQQGFERVSPERLSAYIEATENFFFVQSLDDEEGRLFWYQHGVYEFISKNKAKSIIKDIIIKYNADLATVKAISDTFTQLTFTHSHEHTAHEAELNSEYNLINFQNGFLNLETMQIIHHVDCTEKKSTIQIPCKWTGEEKPTPIFDKYIEHLANGEPEAQQTLLEMIGLTISNIPVHKYKKSLFIIGEGNSGKTQFPKLITRLIGEENATAMPFSKLEKRFQAAKLYHKRLAVDDDCILVSGSEISTFKSLTGGGQLDGERKGQMPFTFVYSGIYIVLANALPPFSGDKGAHVYDRIIPIKCGSSIPREKRDPDILDKIYAEREGIIYKAIQALKRTIDNNYHLTIGESSKKLLEQYKIENDSVFKFLDECCETYGNPKNACTTAQLWNAFKEWCKDTGENRPNKSEFKRNMAAKLKIPVDNLVEVFGGGKRCYPYTLKAEAKAELHIFD